MGLPKTIRRSKMAIVFNSRSEDLRPKICFIQDDFTNKKNHQNRLFEKLIEFICKTNIKKTNYAISAVACFSYPGKVL